MTAVTDVMNNVNKQVQDHAKKTLTNGQQVVEKAIRDADPTKKKDGGDDKLESVPGSEVVVGGRRRRRRRRKSTKKRKSKKSRKRRKKKKTKRRRRRRGRAGVLTPGGQHVASKVGFNFWVNSPEKFTSPHSPTPNKAPQPGGYRR